MPKLHGGGHVTPSERMESRGNSSKASYLTCIPKDEDVLSVGAIGNSTVGSGTMAGKSC